MAKGKLAAKILGPKAVSGTLLSKYGNVTASIVGPETYTKMKKGKR